MVEQEREQKNPTNIILARKVEAKRYWWVLKITVHYLWIKIFIVKRWKCGQDN